ncbi:DUF3134 domain-containing protein [Chroogloeocystis siderophila]|jgi:hypothetical protein|uniref:DUF3134 domain-containing protein n=1 Tax=Chroogloeocystis siderophila 5.2 s.c.1 TaxID=247279 RepID=A0A1U7HQJ3_9CHRO|nr:DUF3134 domain-containing protein [Chroogloeocystis siderophila]OKH25795.1 hypothetical protein NIES1031_12375 [Chroogloeocystis siderophila 5.2 s.c.1]
MRNSALREEPRDQPAGVIPLKNESSLLDWLESSGRLIARDNQEPNYLDDEEEIAGLMDPDDMSYDLEDDDDIVEVED